MVARASWLAFAQRLFYREESRQAKRFSSGERNRRPDWKVAIGPDLARAGVEN